MLRPIGPRRQLCLVVVPLPPSAKTDWENRRLPLSLTVCVIVDLEFPRYGLIRVDAADEVLNDLRKSMQ